MTGERPERTKRKRGNRYKLMAITGYGNAWRMSKDDYGDFMDAYTSATGKPYYTNPKRYPHERVIFNLASESAHKWPEVAAVDTCENGVKSYNCDTYLVWERIDAPRTW